MTTLVDSVCVHANASQPTRLAGLDVLRAVAILLVLFSHCPTPAQRELPVLLETLFSALKRGGWIGVDLFFVLSGFLVSGLLMREHQKHGSVKIGRFLVRRGWKIYPPLAVLVVYMFVHDYLLRGYWPIDRLINQLFFLQNYRPGLANHTWSIAVEEHAYLLIAFSIAVTAVVARIRKRPFSLRWVVWSLPLIAGGALLARMSVADHDGYNHFVHLFPTHHRIDSLMVGVTLAYFYHYHHQATARLIHRYQRPLLLAGVALVLPPFIWSHLDNPWIYTYALISNYLGGVLLVCAVIAWQPTGKMLGKAMVGIGQHSYSIYLWHTPIYVLLLWPILGSYALHPTWDAPFYVQGPMYFVSTILFGIVMSYCVEIPVLKLRDRLSPSRSGALASVPNPTPSSVTKTTPSHKPMSVEPVS